jgi:hypothetical protein
MVQSENMTSKPSVLCNSLLVIRIWDHDGDRMIWTASHKTAVLKNLVESTL